MFSVLFTALSILLTAVHAAPHAVESLTRDIQAPTITTITIVVTITLTPSPAPTPPTSSPGGLLSLPSFSLLLPPDISVGLSKPPETFATSLLGTSLPSVPVSNSAVFSAPVTIGTPATSTGLPTTPDRTITVAPPSNAPTSGPAQASTGSNGLGYIWCTFGNSSYYIDTKTGCFTNCPATWTGWPARPCTSGASVPAMVTIHPTTSSAAHITLSSTPALPSSALVPSAPSAVSSFASTQTATNPVTVGLPPTQSTSYSGPPSTSATDGPNESACPSSSLPSSPTDPWSLGVPPNPWFTLAPTSTTMKTVVRQRKAKEEKREVEFKGAASRLRRVFG
ncbi:hypothetical protein EJ04DRAFT_573038 [Polyplosphaeria fusca]|uniref:Uncharacterized protein n=1 Tax=Polyplosphaeria fusca TaxID=682080 RepID=A0A9P4V7N2_9PLEO|nr:hypothetical protein EJ04DRAFT_573038 [Polyplosphaeria fusca]